MLGVLPGPGNAGPREPENGNGAANRPVPAALLKRDQTAVFSSRKRAICSSFGIAATSRSRNVIFALS